MSTHTTGPWSSSDGDLGFHIKAGRQVLGRAYGTAAAAGATDITDLARLPANANARLMAAAPDLLAALEILADAYDTVGSASSKPIRVARGAIARARGEE